MKKQITLIFIICLSYVQYVNAQDIHFSQFFAAPIYLNPANTGFFDGDVRLGGNNKNQWLSFANAYRTFSGSIDAGIDDLFIDNSRAGIGFLYNSDLAGDGDFGTNQIYLSAAYGLLANKKKSLEIRAGFSLGYVVHGINYDNLNFGNQYVNGQFDPNITPNEIWAYDKMKYVDLNLGLNIFYKPDSTNSYHLGFAVNHVNTSERSFYQTSIQELPVKWSINIGGEHKLKEPFWLEPIVHLQFQQKYSEYNIGALLRLDYNPLALQSVYFGILTRARDAGIVCFGIKYDNLKFLLSYDVNLSKLSNVSRGRGGFEVSLSYVFAKQRPIDIGTFRKCPDFI